MMRGRNLDLQVDRPMVLTIADSYLTRGSTPLWRDPDIPIAELDDESKAWIDNYKIVDTLGIDGQSSDESDGDENGVYNVKLLHWRNKELVKRLNKEVRVRKTMNKYGNRRPGTKQRIRKRRSVVRDLQEMTRPPPTRKPINFYSEEWYMLLTTQQKHDLNAEAELDFLTLLDDDI